MKNVVSNNTPKNKIKNYLESKIFEALLIGADTRELETAYIRAIKQGN